MDIVERMWRGSMGTQRRHRSTHEGSPAYRYPRNIRYLHSQRHQCPHMIQLVRHTSYGYPTAVVRTPDTSHTLVDTLHRLRNPLQLLSTRIAQQLRLLQYLTRLKFPHADRFMASVDVVACYHRVFVRSGRDGDLDLWVGGSEARKTVFQECSGGRLRECSNVGITTKDNILHAP